MNLTHRFLIGAILVSLLLPTGNASAAVRVFPGCGATLAKCIKSSPAGTTIKLKTNSLVPIPDQLVVRKGLRFDAAQGYHPRIGRTTTPPAFLSFDIPGPAAATVSFRGIRFQQVGLGAFFETGTGHRFLFERNRLMLNSGSNGDNGVTVGYGTTGAGSVSFKRNFVSSSGYAVRIAAQAGPVAIVGNRLTAPVATDSAGSIHVSALGSATVRATIASNLIHDSGQCGCGSPGAIRIRGAGMLDVRILNNTVDHVFADAATAAYGIRIGVDAGGHTKAAVYNNSVSTARTGLEIPDDPELEVTGNGNNTFDVMFDSTGTNDLGTITHVDPMYVDQSANDYRLQTVSSLVDAGQTCIAGLPLPRADADYRFRIAAHAVDVGAYERGSTISAGLPGVSRSGHNGPETLVGTSGRDVLCGLGGNDILRGLLGRDFLYGGDGDDRASGSDGNDLIDLIDGVAGNDRASGGRGHDTCIADTGDLRVGCP
jgi:Ca2+-binding RTX toxin-like protein